MNDTPLFTVVIPTYNRPERLANCLQAFTQLDFPREKWEIIVVNDGGATSFSQMSDDLKEALPMRLLDVPHGGPAKARNTGASQARGSFLAFTDDDCVIDPAWLKAFEAAFDSMPLDAVGGQVLNPYPNNLPAVAWGSYMDFLRREIMLDTEGNLLLLLSNNVAYRRSVFEAVGRFDESFPFAAGEDLELGYRLITQGHKQGYYPDAMIWHYHQNTIRGYLKQQFRYGRGNYYLTEALKGPVYTTIPRRKTEGLRLFYQKASDYLHEMKARPGIKMLFFLTPPLFSIGGYFEGYWTAFVRLMLRVKKHFPKRKTLS